MVVYDLISGQLYRQFRMAASVTALAVASIKPAVIMTLNDGSMIVYDIQSGNSRSGQRSVQGPSTLTQLNACH